MNDHSATRSTRRHVRLRRRTEAYALIGVAGIGCAASDAGELPSQRDGSGQATPSSGHGAKGVGSGGGGNGDGAGVRAAGTSGSAHATTNSGSNNARSNGAGGTGSKSSDPNLEGNVDCPTAETAPTPLRRLTRFEYANTVRSLLDVDPSPAEQLPVDEVTDGYNNHAAVLTVSSLHAEKYVLVSEALAAAAVQHLADIAPCDRATKGEKACALDFARTFGRRAFRRPTNADDEAMFEAAYAAGREGGSYAEGIEVMIRAALQSPHFLYRLEITPPANSSAPVVPLNQFELATRLSYLIWGAGPDDALLDAAERGELGTRQAVAAKARAMLEDPKALVAIGEFYNQWLGTTRLDITSKDTDLFPIYSDAVRDGMMRELPAFVEYVLWRSDHKLATLLTAPVAFVTSPLAEVYGVTVPEGTTTPRMVTLPKGQGRSGVLTQAGFLSVQAHPDQTSPVLRGKFTRSKLMCQPPPPPPMDVDISPPDIREGATARERFSAHATAASSCAGCHQLMDPIGFAFENFDALGRYRTQENGKSIDVSGEIAGTSDPDLQGSFVGVRQLGEKLASSDLVKDCVVTQWFRFAAGRSESDSDMCSIATLQSRFHSSGGDLVELVVAMTETDAFWYRRASKQEEGQ